MSLAETLVAERDSLERKIAVIEQWQQQARRRNVLCTATRVPRILFWVPDRMPDVKMALPDEVSQEFWEYLEERRRVYLVWLVKVRERLASLQPDAMRYGVEK